MSSEEKLENNETEVIVTESKKTELTGFLKTLSTFTGDIYSLTCPSFLLSGVSTLEYCRYWADFPELFANISKPSEEVERAIAVLKWYVSTLYGSFASRKDKEKIEKKPFNPILGEQFLARWNDRYDCGETMLFSEQVSHHPPISAMYLENNQAGVSANGHTGQKSTFRATAARIDVTQMGHIIVRMRDYPDTYLITLPSLQILGLWRGAPYVELSGTSVIQSQNYSTVIEFSGKGWISGEKHTFSAITSRVGEKEHLYTTVGTWAGKSIKENHQTKEKTEFFNVETSQRAEPIIKPVEEQNSMESKKIWQYVAKAIDEGDFATASKLKSEIEQRQRDKVKRGEKTISQYFYWLPEDKEFLSFYGLINNKLQLDGKNRETGSWVYKKLSFCKYKYEDNKTNDNFKDN